MQLIAAPLARQKMARLCIGTIAQPAATEYRMFEHNTQLIQVLALLGSCLPPYGLFCLALGSDFGLGEYIDANHPMTSAMTVALFLQLAAGGTVTVLLALLSPGVSVNPAQVSRKRQHLLAVSLLFHLGMLLTARRWAVCA